MLLFHTLKPAKQKTTYLVRLQKRLAQEAKRCSEFHFRHRVAMSNDLVPSLQPPPEANNKKHIDIDVRIRGVRCTARVPISAHAQFVSAAKELTGRLRTEKASASEVRTTWASLVQRFREEAAAPSPDASNEFADEERSVLPHPPSTQKA